MLILKMKQAIFLAEQKLKENGFKINLINDC